MADRETKLVVAAALAALPEEQRVPIVLVDVEGYSVADTARLLGIAEGTVKSRCARGRAKLAKVLGHLRNPSADANVRDGAVDTSHAQRETRSREGR
jgi:RNA polymerase sigma-70 factor (ECF subfamily)